MAWREHSATKKSKMANELQKKTFKGHEFELKFTSDNKNKAKGEAKKYRKRGFHTRVRGMCPGVFAVYRRPKEIKCLEGKSKR
jgi:hypothetical protein